MVFAIIQIFKSPFSLHYVIMKLYHMIAYCAILTDKHAHFSWQNEFEICIFLDQPYIIAETTMPGKYGFDFYGASQSFNVLADYLFGKVGEVSTVN